MEKSPTQEKLEAQRRMDIHDIVAQTLNQHHGQKYMVMLAAVDLGVSDVTVHRWCNQLGIDIAGYRRPSDAVNPGPEAVMDLHAALAICFFVGCGLMLAHSIILFRMGKAMDSLYADLSRVVSQPEDQEPRQ